MTTQSAMIDIHARNRELTERLNGMVNYYWDPFRVHIALYTAICALLAADPERSKRSRMKYAAAPLREIVYYSHEEINPDILSSRTASAEERKMAKQIISILRDHVAHLRAEAPDDNMALKDLGYTLDSIISSCEGLLDDELDYYRGFLGEAAGYAQLIQLSLIQ